MLALYLAIFTKQLNHWQLQKYDSISSPQNLDLMVHKLSVAKFIQLKNLFLQISEQMQNKKVDELTNKIRIIETEHHRLEEDAIKKQEDLTVTVS